MTDSFKFDALHKTLTHNPPPLPSLKGVPFGTLFTPHMLLIDYSDGKWSDPRIEPFHNLSLPPQTSCLNYGTTCFEGMKAYADIEEIENAKANKDTEIHRLRLFRPDMNIRRLKASMERLCLPSFDENEMLALIEEFVRTEKNYVPRQYGYSLYLRPNAIATSPTLAIYIPDKLTLYLIASPVGPYYQADDDGGNQAEAKIKPVKLLVEEFHHRAWPGGTGGSKLGANYAGPLLVQKEAEKKGYDQVLWLGAQNEVEEVGAMNFCVIWRNSSGKREIITAPLDGTILPGVTRDSILSLAEKWGEFGVSTRSFTIDELVTALTENRVEECFGCGTAAIVSPVKALCYRGVEYKVPCPDDSITRRFMKEIMDIQYGVKPNEWSRLVKC